MSSTSATITRRQALQGLGVGATLLALPGCATTTGAPAAAAHAEALLDRIAWNLLEHSPTGATALGIDTGDKAYLRGRLGGASPEAIERLAATLRADLATVRATDTSALDPATRTSFEVVESAYSVALDGLALP